MGGEYIRVSRMGGAMHFLSVVPFVVGGKAQ